MDRTFSVGMLGLGIALAGCQDLGLEYNLPRDEALQRPPSPLVAAVHGQTEVRDQLIVDGRLWVPSGLPLTSTAGDLRPIGSAGGSTVYARSWDQPPYDEVFTQLRDTQSGGSFAGSPDAQQWQAFAPVIGGTGATPAPGGSVGPGTGEPGSPTAERDLAPAADTGPTVPDTGSAVPADTGAGTADNQGNGS